MTGRVQQAIHERRLIYGDIPKPAAEHGPRFDECRMGSLDPSLLDSLDGGASAKWAAIPGRWLNGIADAEGGRRPLPTRYCRPSSALQIGDVLESRVAR